MRVFFDSSALAKRYVREAGSEDVAAISQQATALGVSILAVPEIISALNRRKREEALSASDYVRVKRQLALDIADADLVHLKADVVARSVQLLEQHSLRAMDALHVASALVWKADLFVSSDRRQLAAAAEAGLKIREV